MKRFAILLFLALPLTLGAYTFNRNLKRGDSGADVKELQKVLNALPLTRVAESGPGSLGAETTYFGTLTHSALTRFQEAYATDILRPAGLTAGTGYFGPSTRTFINGFKVSRAGETGETPQSDVTEIDSNTLFPPIKGFYIKEIKPYVAAPGAQIALALTNVVESGYIELGTQKIDLVGNGSSFKFVVPSDTVSGVYDVAVASSQGKSENSVALVVNSSKNSRPAISSVSPKIIGAGDTVTVKGSNFTTRGNRVYSLFGEHLGISSSDGTTLTFTFTLNKYYEWIEEKGVPVEVLDVFPTADSFTIVNGNGVSEVSESAKYNLKI